MDFQDVKKLHATNIVEKKRDYSIKLRPKVVDQKPHMKPECVILIRQSQKVKTVRANRFFDRSMVVTDRSTMF